MKLKTLSVVAGVIALSIGIAPFAVQAQTPTQPRLLLAQGHKGGGPDLGLSNDQKAQIKTIRENTRTQINNILGVQDGQNGQNREAMRQRWSSLSSDQKNQIKQLRASEKQQINAVLTPDQQTKLQQWEAAHPKHNHNSSN